MRCPGCAGPGGVMLCVRASHHRAKLAGCERKLHAFSTGACTLAIGQTRRLMSPPTGMQLLLQRDLLHPPAFFAKELLQACQQFRPDARRVVGEIDQVALSTFEDLEAELVDAVE